MTMITVISSNILSVPILLQYVRYLLILILSLQVVSIFLYNVVECKCIGYSIVALMTEVNSIFLHGRKIMQMLGLPFDHWIYRINVYLNFFSLIICRFINIIAIFFTLYNNFHRFNIIHWFLTASANFVVFVINFVLFLRLLKNDVFRKTKYAKKHASKANNNHNKDDPVKQYIADKKDD